MVKQAPKECIYRHAALPAAPINAANDPTAALGLRAVVAAHSMTI
jgi:hypothetical protein